jgi:ubiquinol-cytochrome c reductase iron-sulfur subunit
MAPLTRTASSLLRTCSRAQLTTARIASVAGTQQRRGKASEVSTTSSFDSPFKGSGASPTTNIPDFSKYRSSSGNDSNKVFSYFVVGSLGLVTAAGAKATIQGGYSRIERRRPMGIE